MLARGRRSSGAAHSLTTLMSLPIHIVLTAARVSRVSGMSHKANVW
jgi:hypothetical protein